MTVSIGNIPFNSTCLFASCFYSFPRRPSSAAFTLCSVVPRSMALPAGPGLASLPFIATTRVTKEAFVCVSMTMIHVWHARYCLSWTALAWSGIDSKCQREARAVNGIYLPMMQSLPYFSDIIFSCSEGGAIVHECDGWPFCGGVVRQVCWGSKVEKLWIEAS